MKTLFRWWMAFVLLLQLPAAHCREAKSDHSGKHPPGSSDWQLTRVRVDGGNYRSTWIEGYCSRQSVKAGESIDIKVSTNPPRPFNIEFFRTGYYEEEGSPADVEGRPAGREDAENTPPGAKSARMPVGDLAHADDSWAR